MLIQEERRRTVLERKRANMNLSQLGQGDTSADVTSRRRHHDDEELESHHELIAPSTLEVDAALDI